MKISTKPRYVALQLEHYDKIVEHLYDLKAFVLALRTDEDLIRAALTNTNIHLNLATQPSVQIDADVQRKLNNSIDLAVTALENLAETV